MQSIHFNHEELLERLFTLDHQQQVAYLNTLLATGQKILKNLHRDQNREHLESVRSGVTKEMRYLKRLKKIKVLDWLAINGIINRDICKRLIGSDMLDSLIRENLISSATKFYEVNDNRGYVVYHLTGMGVAFVDKFGSTSPVKNPITAANQIYSTKVPHNLQTQMVLLKIIETNATKELKYEIDRSQALKTNQKTPDAIVSWQYCGIQNKAAIEIERSPKYRHELFQFKKLLSEWITQSSFNDEIYQEGNEHLKGHYGELQLGEDGRYKTGYWNPKRSCIIVFDLRSHLEQYLEYLTLPTPIYEKNNQGKWNEVQGYICLPSMKSLLDSGHLKLLVWDEVKDNMDAFRLHENVYAYYTKSTTGAGTVIYRSKNNPDWIIYRLNNEGFLHIESKRGGLEPMPFDTFELAHQALEAVFHKDKLKNMSHAKTASNSRNSIDCDVGLHSNPEWEEAEPLCH